MNIAPILHNIYRHFISIKLPFVAIPKSLLRQNSLSGGGFSQEKKRMQILSKRREEVKEKKEIGGDFFILNPPNSTFKAPPKKHVEDVRFSFLVKLYLPLWHGSNFSPPVPPPPGNYSNIA